MSLYSKDSGTKQVRPAFGGAGNIMRTINFFISSILCSLILIHFFWNAEIQTRASDHEIVVASNAALLVNDEAAASPAPEPTAALADRSTELEHEELEVTASASSSAVSSESAAPAVEVLTTQFDESQELHLVQKVVQGAQTGGNDFEATGAATLHTGEIVLTAVTETIANTTAVGSGDSDVSIHHSPLTEDIFVGSNSTPCSKTATQSAEAQALTQATVARIVQSATVSSALEQTALTGANSLSTDHAQLQTGDVALHSYSFNMINTAAIGECWYYGVINLFDGGSGDIHLPELLSHSTATSSETASLQHLEEQVEVAQHAAHTFSVLNQADTGQQHGGSEVQTGDVSSTTTTATALNTSLSGDNWMLLRILNPAYWQGTIVGTQPHLQSESATTADFWWQLPAGKHTSYRTSDVQLKQEAVVDHSIVQSANTGENLVSAQAGAIRTGAVSFIQKSASIINTAVIGSNWFFLTLMLFDEYSGDIVLISPPDSSSALSEELLVKTQKESAKLHEVAYLTAQMQEQQEEVAEVVTHSTELEPNAERGRVANAVVLGLSSPVNDFFEVYASGTVALRSPGTGGAQRATNTPSTAISSSSIGPLAAEPAWCVTHQPWCSALGFAISTTPLAAIFRRE